MEALLSRELYKLDAKNISAKDARVYFDADELMIAKANLWLRTADRVYIELGNFDADNFDLLFNCIYNIDWAERIPKDAKFTVSADSVRSTLKSVSDIQSISKKAIVEKLKKRYKISRFPETGSEYPLYISLYKDNASVLLNTSGAGLSRRGYRILNSAAPMRETLAAGIVMLSRYRADEVFIDPMCGSGTVAIEAALQALNIAPGFERVFAFENWGDEHRSNLKWVKAEAKEKIVNADIIITASDIDDEALKLARFHAKKAGVEKHIKISKADVKDLKLDMEKGVIVTNPPYAVRMGEQNKVRGLYKKMGEAFLKSGCRLYILSADDEFERYFKKRADKKRKLYNGNIRCTLYQYFK